MLNASNHRSALPFATTILLVVCAGSSNLHAQQLTIPPAGSTATDADRNTSEDNASKVRTFRAPSAESDLGLPEDEPTVTAAVPLRSESHAANDLAVTVATPLLARFVNDQRQESDPVATRVMEASVSGMQTTTTDVRLSSLNCTNHAHMEIQTSGTVSSNTVGVTPQAAVNTLGNHTFEVSKPVYFDGRRFLTKQAYGSLQVRQFPQAVNTTVARTFPLLGQIGNRIAWREVYRRMPMTNSIVVRQVADDVLPTVNRSVDKELSQLNRRWSNIRRQLARFSRISDLKWFAASTDRSLTVSLTNPAVPRGAVRPSKLTPELREDEACCLLLDELAVNHWLDRQQLENLELSDMGLKQLATDLPELLKRPTDLIERFRNDPVHETPALLFTVKLAASRPVRVYFRGGHLHASIRFQVVPRIGEPSLLQQVTVQLRGEPAPEDRWQIEMKDAQVAPADQRDEPDTWTRLIEGQLDNVLNNQTPSAMTRVLKSSEWDERFPDLKLDRVQAIDGLLRIAFRPADRSLSL